MTEFARDRRKTKVGEDVSIIAVFAAGAAVLCMLIALFGDPSKVTPRDPDSIAFSP